MKFLVLGSGDRRQVLYEEVEKLRPLIQNHGEIVFEDLTHSCPIDVEADFAIVVGGDGSILRSAKQMGSRQIPVIGVNFGKLGFLADIQPGDLDQALTALASNKYRIVEHLMISCQLFQNESLISESLGLNEVAILGGPPYSIQNIKLYVDSGIGNYI